MSIAPRVTITSGMRLPELDALRGLLAVYVMLVHYTYRYDGLFGHTLPVPILGGGVARVQALFAISGFIISMTLPRTRTLTDFAFKRVCRLYPAYWLAVVVTFAITTLAALPGRTVSLTDALINLSMLQQFVGVPHVDGAYWTLTVELLFYFWIAVLFFSGAQRFLIPILCAWFALALLLKFAEDVLHVALAPYVAKALICPWIPFFGMGMLAQRALQLRRWDRSGVAMMAAATITAALIWGHASAMVAFVIAVTFMLLLDDRLTWLRWQPLVFLGTISYPLYLLHQNIGYVGIRWLEAQGWHPLLAITATSAFMLASAYVVTVRVEQPAMRWLRDVKPQLNAAWSALAARR